jgi:DNA-directed DNA polymerase III PolC
MKHRKTYSLPVFPSFSSSGSPSSISSSEPEFVELLARSNFSFLQGASHPEEIVLCAKSLDYKGLAICDVNGLYGVVRGYQANEKPSLFDASQLAFSHSDGTPKKPFHYMCGAELTPHDASPIVLLPMNKEGYVRLCHLLTWAKRKAPKGHISTSLQDILTDNDNLIAFPLPPWDEKVLKRLQKAYQDRIYLPVTKDFSWEATELYQQALRIEETTGILPFATSRPLYHQARRKPLHDVLTCILHKTTLNAASTKLALNSERYLKSRKSIAELFRDRPDMVARTLEIAARVHFSLGELKYRYPQEHLPAGKTAAEFLRELAYKGVEWRYGKTAPSKEVMEQVRLQIEHELKIIHHMEYEDYFLTLWDICNFAREKNILHQGRGSAANSIVCFLIGLTSIDPIALKLMFERFISSERGEPPDIDIDFEHERREEVIQYIYGKYGDQRAAMVCTVISYRSRMALREVAKTLGLTSTQVDGLIKFMGREGLSGLSTTPDFAKFGLTSEKFRLLLTLAQELKGFPRHLGIHSGGFVISHGPLIDIVPVESATMEGRFVIQWNKDDINTLGLMKIDVLSLGMLSAVRKAFDLLRKHRGRDLTLATIPPDHKGTYEMIQKADTVGVFQIESRAQMSLLPRLKPKDFYDLVIEVAIVRPGPIQGGLVHPYLRRRNGREKITYAHDKLKPILGKTLGIPLFQEQVMQIAVIAAGFTPGESDELRRVVSSAWKKKAVMHGLHQRVINGRLSNGLTREYAEQIYKTIEGFSAYGFPESHAASFALITYASCYLKHNYPDIFACALLNSQPMGFYPPRQLISDAQRHGARFLALDVQASDWEYTIEDASNGVRTGFCSVYGLREEPIRTLVTERLKHGMFRDLSDFVQRTKLSRQILIRLSAAGAFAGFGLNAREALWILQGMSLDPQSLFFGEQPDEAFALPEESSWDSVRREYSTKGFSLENHPIAILRPQLQSVKPYVSAAQLERLRDRSPVRMAGLKSLLQKPPTAKGMCFVSLEDETGIFNVVCTPDIYMKYRLVLLHSVLIEVEGQLESREGVRNVKAQVIRTLTPPATALGPVVLSSSDYSSITG